VPDWRHPRSPPSAPAPASPPPVPPPHRNIYRHKHIHLRPLRRLAISDPCLSAPLGGSFVKPGSGARRAAGMTRCACGLGCPRYAPPPQLNRTSALHNLRQVQPVGGFDEERHRSPGTPRNSNAKIRRASLSTHPKSHTPNSDRNNRCSPPCRHSTSNPPQAYALSSYIFLLMRVSPYYIYRCRFCFNLERKNRSKSAIFGK
jgi:hypothetical protein